MDNNLNYQKWNPIFGSLALLIGIFLTFTGYLWWGTAILIFMLSINVFITWSSMCLYFIFAEGHKLFFSDNTVIPYEVLNQITFLAAIYNLYILGFPFLAGMGTFSLSFNLLVTLFRNRNS